MSNDEPSGSEFAAKMAIGLPVFDARETEIGEVEGVMSRGFLVRLEGGARWLDFAAVGQVFEDAVLLKCNHEEIARYFII